MLQIEYTGLPVILAIAIKGLVSHHIDECFIIDLHKIKMLVAYMKQISRKDISSYC